MTGINTDGLWINGQAAKGYLKEPILEAARRYVGKADWQAYQAEYLEPERPEPPEAEDGGAMPRGAR